jgi:hypothetical protein
MTEGGLAWFNKFINHQTLAVEQDDAAQRRRSLERWQVAALAGIGKRPVLRFVMLSSMDVVYDK